MRDFYYILGVDKNATVREIAEAYRVLSAKLNPGQDCRDAFLNAHLRELTEAHDILSSVTKRKLYDTTMRRYQRKRIAAFKAKTMNAVMAFALIFIIGLAGFYVIHFLNRPALTKPQRLAVTAAPATHIKKHRKKRRKSYMASTPVKKLKIKADTANRKLTPSIAIATTTKVAPAHPVIVKPDTVKIIKRLIPIASVKAAAATIAKADSGYTAYLKHNLPDLIYVHSQADYMSPVVTTLASNAKVRVLQNNGMFYKVYANNTVGYLPKWALERQ